MSESETNKMKKKTLYVTLIVPALIVSIIGTVVIRLALSQGTQSIMTEIERETVSKMPELMFNVIEEEKDNLLGIAEFLNDENSAIDLQNIENSIDLNKIINEFKLFNALYVTPRGQTIKSYISTVITTNAEKMAIDAALSGKPKVYVSVKGKEVLAVSATKMGENVLVLEKELSNTQFLELHASEMDVVMTIFVDDIRASTTIKDANGNYLVGTLLNNEVIYEQVYSKGIPYNGNNIIQGIPYVTIYAPLANDDDAKTMIFMGISVGHIKDISNRIARQSLIFILLTIYLIISLIIVVIAATIMRPLKKNVIAFGSLNGNSGIADMTIRIPVKTNNEIGSMGTEINKFVATQQDLLNNVKEASDSLQEVGLSLASSSQQSASAVSQIMANIESVKHSTEKQSQALYEVENELNKNISGISHLDGLIENQSAGIVESSAAIEEMIGNIDSVTRSINKMAEEFKTLISITEDGKSRQNDVSVQVTNMAEQSKKLADANNAISQIASQTNLLAMNAAIEAAHAGEAGKGFAVVADEIRKLAEDSSKQSKVIKENITDITKSISGVVESSELSVKGFEQITDKVSSTDELVKQIDNAMEEQQVASKQVLVALHEVTDSTAQVQSTSKDISNGVQLVKTATDNLSQITEMVSGSMDEMAAGVTEINSSTQNVSDQATTTKENIDILHGIISKFKLE